MTTLANTKPRDLTRDNRLAQACAEFLAASAELEAARARADALRAEILAKVRGGTTLAAGHVVQVAEVPGTPDRVVTRDMVGTTIKGRGASRRLKVTPAGGGGGGDPPPGSAGALDLRAA